MRACGCLLAMVWRISLIPPATALGTPPRLLVPIITTATFSFIASSSPFWSRQSRFSTLLPEMPKLPALRGAISRAQISPPKFWVRESP